MTAHDDAMPEDITDAEAFHFEGEFFEPVCDKCGAAVMGARDSSHRLGRLHATDTTTADRWCRR